VTLLTRFTPISRAIATSTTSTIPLYLLPDVIRVVAGLEPGDTATAAIGYPGHTRGTNYLGLPIIDAGKAQAAVAEVLAALAVEDGGGAAAFEDECG